MRPIERLYIVYNADSDWWSLLVDVARKLAGRDECPLCTLTHGATGERASYRACKEALRVTVEPVHRDDLTAELKQFLSTEKLPVVAARAGGELVLLLDRAQVESLGGRTHELEPRLRQRAGELGLAFS